MKNILFKSLIIIVLLISIFIIPIFYPTGIAMYFRLFFLCLIFIESVKLFKTIFIDKKRNEIISNAATVLFTFFIIFLILEVIFMFIPRSHKINCTLASKLWFSKYYQSINSFGYRDKEPDNNNPVILFVGDSFTGGHGLKSVNDRFSNIVGEELNKKGNKFSIINIGLRGLHTKEEYIRMKNFLYMTKIKPQIIVLQYFGDDIVDVAKADGTIKFDASKYFKNVNKFPLPVIACSYFFNYIFWSFPKDYITEPFQTFINEAYKNNSVLSKHKDELKLFVDYAKNNSIQLIVVVFPFLEDIETSNLLYVEAIINFFNYNNATTINVSNLVNNIPVSERIINNNDPHASKLVNRIVAHEILKKISKYPD